MQRLDLVRMVCGEALPREIVPIKQEVVSIAPPDRPHVSRQIIDSLDRNFVFYMTGRDANRTLEGNVVVSYRGMSPDNEKTLVAYPDGSSQTIAVVEILDDSLQPSGSTSVRVPKFTLEGFALYISPGGTNTDALRSVPRYT
jgi:hypothetical protein